MDINREQIGRFYDFVAGFKFNHPKATYIGVDVHIGLAVAIANDLSSSAYYAPEQERPISAAFFRLYGVDCVAIKERPDIKPWSAKAWARYRHYTGSSEYKEEEFSPDA